MDIDRMNQLYRYKALLDIGKTAYDIYNKKKSVENGEIGFDTVMNQIDSLNEDLDGQCASLQLIEIFSKVANDQTPIDDPWGIGLNEIFDNSAPTEGLEDEFKDYPLLVELIQKD